MRPDGAGTDESLSPEERRRIKPRASLESTVFKAALAFAIFSLIVWGAFYLSQRATMPDLSEDNPALQQ